MDKEEKVRCFERLLECTRFEAVGREGGREGGRGREGVWRARVSEGCSQRQRGDRSIPLSEEEEQQQEEEGC